MLDELRQAALTPSEHDSAALAQRMTPNEVVAELERRCEAAGRVRHQRVINATGVVLHTGIGRAPLSDLATDAIQDAAGAVVVEVDPVTGERNQRESAVAALLCDVTGAEAGLVVNNNAAAVVLGLAALASGREVVLSRGQLVEIGGGFRMPDVMVQAGCELVEVGATNRTHLRDFEAAITARTGLLMLVHPSNFRIVGFTSMPSRRELVELGARHGLAVMDDVGSGYLLDYALPGLEGEPGVLDCVRDGAAVSCFSGDKLLGGPQCGILVGDAERIGRIRAHPLYRAFRCDKLSLAALEATLRIYRDGAPIEQIPVLRALAKDQPTLQQEAERLAAAIGERARVVPSESYAGSGANPARPLPSHAVALAGGKALADALRVSDATGPGVFARIVDDEVLLDVRALADADFEPLVARVRAAAVP